MSTLLKKYSRLPRSMRWAAGFLVVLIAYFAVVEPVLDNTMRLNLKADQLAAKLNQEHDLLSSDTRKGRLLADGREAFGEPLLPGDPANRPESLHNVIDRILDSNGVLKRQKAERRIPLRGDELSGLLGSASAQATAERIVIDVTFEASPETVTKIIAEMEKAREVALISKVDMRRPDAGRDAKSSAAVSTAKILKVTISPEAWIVQGAGATAFTSTGGAK